MAEFYFYGSDKDSLSVLDAVLGPGDLYAISCLSHPTTDPPRYSSVHPELLEALRINRTMYLVGDFSHAPPHFTELKRGDYSGMFVIDERRGGPVMKLSMPYYGKEDGLWHLAAGNLFHQPYFWDDAITRAEPATEELRSAFADVRKRIRSVVARTRLHGIDKTLWIGPDALWLLKSDEALIMISGNWYRGDGTFVKPNPVGPPKD